MKVLKFDGSAETVGFFLGVRSRCPEWCAEVNKLFALSFIHEHRVLNLLGDV
jgi:hypothetical protein